MFVNWASVRLEFQGWALVGTQGVPAWTLDGARRDSGSLSSSSPFLPTPTLANLDNLLGQKPGFLSGSSLPILEIGETTGRPTPFPNPSVRVGLSGTSAIMSVPLAHLPLELENALYSGG